MGWEGHPVAEEQPLCCSRALGAPCTVLYLRGTEARNCLLVASPQAEGSESGPWGLSPRFCHGLGTAACSVTCKELSRYRQRPLLASLRFESTGIHRAWRTAGAQRSTC